MSFRVVYDYNHQLGKHQYIIETYKIEFSPAPTFRKRKMEWQRFGGGYFFDDKEEAIKQCDLLNAGRKVIYPHEGDVDKG